MSDSIVIVQPQVTQVKIQAPGVLGPIGPAGYSVYTGAGVPSNSLGVNGDTYMRTDTGDLYSKSAGVWSVIGNFMGPQGIQGQSVYSGATVPSNALGVDGDTYIRSTNGDLYSKSAGVWALVGNLTGLSESEFDELEFEFARTLTASYFKKYGYTSGVLDLIEIFSDNTEATLLFSKQLTYSSGELTSIVLTRVSPAAVRTKSLSYLSGDLVSITYS